MFHIEAKIPRGFNPAVTKWGTFKDTQFRQVLSVKIGARVMLIYNIGTIDGLVNGQLGSVVGIEQNKNGEVQFIIVSFDDKEIGKKHRQHSQTK